MIVKLVSGVLPINIICLLIKAEKLTEILSGWKLLSHFSPRTEGTSCHSTEQTQCD